MDFVCVVLKLVEFVLFSDRKIFCVVVVVGGFVDYKVVEME